MKNRFKIETLGEAKLKSPVSLSTQENDHRANYVQESERLIFDVRKDLHQGSVIEKLEDISVEIAGPREKIYFEPSKVKAAILTCGGLSPGLNNVIRAIVRTLTIEYGVHNIYGIRNGFHGLLPEYGLEPMELDLDNVDDIHNIGGTILGASRGGGNRTEEIVDSIERMNLSLVFIIGGDGTQKGSSAIAKEIKKRGLKVAVVGIPKTIDNDLQYVDTTFGFETAVEQAVRAIKSAHVEALGAQNGVGLVKLMGRHSGFIAAHATLATNDVNIILIPEIPFKFESMVEYLIKRLERKDHAVIVVAEGAGQDLLESTNETDASGNKKMGDIGLYLKEKLSESLTEKNIDHKLIYIDPGYMVRSVVANPYDALLCTRLGRNAVHGAMSGKTNMVISILHSEFVYLPISLVTESRKIINTDDSLWRDVVLSSAQPAIFE